MLKLELFAAVYLYNFLIGETLCFSLLIHLKMAMFILSLFTTVKKEFFDGVFNMYLVYAKSKSGLFYHQIFDSKVDALFQASYFYDNEDEFDYLIVCTVFEIKWLDIMDSCSFQLNVFKDFLKGEFKK